ncbi:hypothetical protein J6590_046113 [Homalodisca vitripennis]|nr:hypothetical protein J6590_046113 [Homalodisca vitripennis]
MKIARLCSKLLEVLTRLLEDILTELQCCEEGFNEPNLIGISYTKLWSPKPPNYLEATDVVLVGVFMDKRRESEVVGPEQLPSLPLIRALTLTLPTLPYPTDCGRAIQPFHDRGTTRASPNYPGMIPPVFPLHCLLALTRCIVRVQLIVLSVCGNRTSLFALGVA